jgi:hypothetical protein
MQEHALLQRLAVLNVRRRAIESEIQKIQKYLNRPSYRRDEQSDRRARCKAAWKQGRSLR